MAKIDRSTASIHMHGIDLDPEVLTQILGCSPTAAAKRGDVIVIPDGGTRVVRKGFWRLEYGEPDAIDLEEKILNLLGQMTNDLEVWQEISQSFDCDVLCGLFLDGWNEGFELSPDLLGKLTDRGLKISFDIYSPTNTWHEQSGEL